jgi:hypothetical protein
MKFIFLERGGKMWFVGKKPHQIWPYGLRDMAL